MDVQAAQVDPRVVEGGAHGVSGRAEVGDAELGDPRARHGDAQPEVDDALLLGGDRRRSARASLTELALISSTPWRIGGADRRR